MELLEDGGKALGFCPLKGLVGFIFWSGNWGVINTLGTEQSSSLNSSVELGTPLHLHISVRLGDAAPAGLSAPGWRSRHGPRTSEQTLPWAPRTGKGADRLPVLPAQPGPPRAPPRSGSALRPGPGLPPPAPGTAAAASAPAPRLG